MAVNERAARALKDIIKRHGNGTCADCGAPDPEWGSCSLGVFICLICSGIHRNIPDIGKVKSVRLSHWEDSEVQFMEENGNEVAKSKFEAYVPVYYYKPTHKDCQVLKEQWIRAKYERQEFTQDGKPLVYEEGTRDGVLMKRGRDNGQFLSRRFVLSEREGTLKYYTKLDAKEPKAVIKVDTINASFQPEKIGNPNGLQITYLKDYNTRNIFVYHDNSKEIVDWFNSIRAVQLHYLKVAFPGSSDLELKPKLTRNFLKEGYMEKTGPRQTEGFKKRWFTLDHRRLMYFKDPLWRPSLSINTDRLTRTSRLQPDPSPLYFENETLLVYFYTWEYLSTFSAGVFTVITKPRRSRSISVTVTFKSVFGFSVLYLILDIHDIGLHSVRVLFRSFIILFWKSHEKGKRTRL
ncbi:arf-GAP with dual PH domain-containing protein 1 isoform X1 [Neoarius graeffei]|uniref:arf-GAP with dual PH domain-containing protein 1 isoform X1 n=1 Tax=Neoarius graeffei TaxID=443677 RepID=UPI00298CD7BF|nr:arf-GAP with dual PH domain-containing protein 1 isoform X1 [Neoarius graeffei]